MRGHGYGLDLPHETSGSRFARPHSRMTDLLSGTVAEASIGNDENGKEKESFLWVCDKCFKYMKDSSAWELHVVSKHNTPLPVP